MPSQSSAQPPRNVLSHWYAVFDGVHFSSQDFYNSIEQELVARKLPQLRHSWIEMYEGGAFSDKRIYLRLSRERYAFDLCAAPFGTGYFFSLRLIEEPRAWWPWAAFVAITVAARIFYVHAIWQALAIAIGCAVVGVIGYAIDNRQQNRRSPGSRGSGEEMIDSLLLRFAIVGHVYERFRRDTYYRYDTRLLFLTVISDIVRLKVSTITASKGVRLSHSYEYSPVLGTVYKPTVIELPH